MYHRLLCAAPARVWSVPLRQRSTPRALWAWRRYASYPALRQANAQSQTISESSKAPLIALPDPKGWLFMREAVTTEAEDTAAEGGKAAADSRKVRSLYFEHLMLRDMCQCSACVDPSTQQRHFAFADIPKGITANCELRDAKTVEVTWTNDVPGYGPDHISTFTRAQLVAAGSHQAWVEASYALVPPYRWNSRRLQSVRAKLLEFDFADYVGFTEIRDSAVYELLRYGLIFIRGVPMEENSVRHVLERIGPLRNTFYGETWDVRSVPEAKNVAYTARDLGFHQDLLYMAEPPGLQALHVIKASATGGESLFSDGATAINAIAHNSPYHLKPLLNHKVTYRYRNNGEWYERARPTLEGGVQDPREDVGKFFDTNSKSYFLTSGGYGTFFDAINWSPPFQAPFREDRGHTTPGMKGVSRLEAYRAAASALQARIEDPENVYETRLEPGTCVIFNNRRIMHARKAFPAGAAKGEPAAEERWLRGAYADLDPLWSRYRVARATYERQRAKATDKGPLTSHGYGRSLRRRTDGAAVEGAPKLNWRFVRNSTTLPKSEVEDSPSLPDSSGGEFAPKSSERAFEPNFSERFSQSKSLDKNSEPQSFKESFKIEALDQIFRAKTPREERGA